MIKFFKKTALFMILGLVFYVIGLFVTTIYLNGVHINNWETESNIWIIKENRTYDLLLLGSSHGRVFSRHFNHQRVENIIDGKMINLSQGYAGAFSPMLVYLNTFHDKNNYARNIVILLDPWMFFRKGSNESIIYYLNDYVTIDNMINIFQYGHIPLKDLIYLLLKNNRNNYLMTLTALLTKNEGLKETWYNEVCEDVLDADHNIEIDKYMKYGVKYVEDRYTNGLDQYIFNENKNIFIELIEFCHDKKFNLKIIIPPTLTPEMGHPQVVKTLRQLQNIYSFDFYDHLNSANEYKYFYDLDHMNTRGVVHFTTRYLKPVLD